MKKLTDEERKEIEKKIDTGVCKCGHRKANHSKFINGLFIGCQYKDCNCKKFEWPT